MLMTDEEKAIKAMNIRENFMTTNRSGASTLNGRRPESEQRLNVSRPSHGRKLGLLRLQLHGVSRRAHSALCKNFIYSLLYFLLFFRRLVLNTILSFYHRRMAGCHHATAESKVQVCVHGKEIRHLTDVHSLL